MYMYMGEWQQEANKKKANQRSREISTKEFSNSSDDSSRGGGAATPMAQYFIAWDCRLSYVCCVI